MEKTAPPHHHHYQCNSARLRAFLLCGGLLLIALPAVGDAAFTTNIKSDGTLPTPTSISQVGNVYNINGGTIRGSNLFQSFQFFSVGTGDIASFNGPGGIANILSRVTGGQQSMIDGQLRTTIPGANLYLMNPSGILFGPNASLNVSGSFHVTTADYLRLTDNVRFTAVPGAQDALLTTAPVAAFGFLSNSPASVSVQGSVLRVPTGQTLSIIAGDLDITSSPFGAFLNAAHGQINIASVASHGEVIPNQPGFPPALDVSSFASLGTITESNFSNVSVSSGFGSGTVVIRGGRLTVTNSAQINANTTGNFNGAPVSMDIQLTDDLVVSNNAALQSFSTGAGRAGNIQIVAGSADTNTGSVQLINGGGIFSATLGTIKGPDILINTGRLEAKDGGYVYSTTRVSSGRGGDIDVTAGSVLLQNLSNPSLFTGIDADVSCNGSNCGGTGQGGNLSLTTNSLVIKNGAFLSTPTFIRGPGGNLTVNASDIFISGSNDPSIFTGIFTNTFGTGKGGHANVTADNLIMTNRASIGASTLGPGDAGGATLNVGTLDISSRSFISATSFLGTGNSADLGITVRSLVITGVSTSLNPFVAGEFTGLSVANGIGRAGNLRIAADSILVTDQGSISATAFSSANGGKIDIQTGSLVVTGGADIQAIARSSGRGGDIDITAGSVTVSGVAPVTGGHSAISSQSQFGSGAAGSVRIATGSMEVADGGVIDNSTFGSGAGGNITVNADQVLLNNRARISAGGFGTGNAGDISITAADQFVMRDSTVTTQATVADGGNIDIHAVNLVQLINSSITTSVGTGAGNGGNITIDPHFFVMKNSQILAEAFGGDGGNIHITADIFLIDGVSVIDASSSLGVSGSVNIDSPITNLSDTLAPLPQEFLHAGALLQSRCAARMASGSTSSFVVTSRDGVPAEPGGLLPSPIAEVGMIGRAESAPEADTLLALNLAVETLDGGCAQ